MKNIVGYFIFLIGCIILANSFIETPQVDYIEKLSVMKLPSPQKTPFESDINTVLGLAYQQDTVHAYYINRYAQLAIDEQKKFGFPASVKLAQFILEGGYTNDTPNGSRLASQANNPFGIKYYGPNVPKRIPNWEAFIDEGYILAKDDCKELCKFIKFKGYWHAFRYHSYFTVGTEDFPSHYVNYITTGDWEDWVSALSKGHYASSKTYGRDLTNIIRKYQLYLLDSHL